MQNHVTDMPATRRQLITALGDAVLLAVAAPAAVFPGFGLRGVLLAALLGVWVWRWWRLGRQALPPTPVNVALLALSGMVLVSAAISYDLLLSLPKITGVALGLYVLLLVGDHARHDRRWLGLVVAGYLALGAAIALFSMLTTAWTVKFDFLRPVIDNLPSLGISLPGAEEGLHPNQVAGSLTLFLPLALALIVGQARRLRANVLAGSGLLAGLVLTTLATGATLLLTQSRTAWGATLAGLTVMLVITVPRLWPLLVLVPGIVIAPFVLLSVVPDADATTETLNVLTVQSRLDIWRMAQQAIADFPLTGLGFNVFRQTLHSVYPIFSISPAYDLGHAHNQFIQVALDIGLPGLVAYVALLLVSGVMLVQVVRQQPPSFERSLALGTLGSLAAHLTFGLADALALGAKPGIAFWLLLGIGLALWQRTQARPAP